MKNAICNFTMLLIILSMLGCAPASSALVGTGETITGLQSVVRGEVGTFIMTDGQAYMMAWPRGQNYAWTVISQARGIDLNAVRSGATTLSELLLDLEKNGFYYISCDQLPKDIVSTVLGWSLSQLLLTGIESFPTVFIVPLILFEPTPTAGVVL